MSEELASAAVPEVKRPSVVVIEDDRSTRFVLSQLLREAGYRVHEASRLSEARALMSLSPDLVVVDGLLPDGTGVEFIHELRAQHHLVPVIFLSSFFRDFQSFKQLRQAMAVHSVLHKPVTAQALIAEVSNALVLEPAPDQPVDTPRSDREVREERIARRWHRRRLLRALRAKSLMRGPH